MTLNYSSQFLYLRIANMFYFLAVSKTLWYAANYSTRVSHESFRSIPHSNFLTLFFVPHHLDNCSTHCYYYMYTLFITTIIWFTAAKSIEYWSAKCFQSSNFSMSFKQLVKPSCACTTDNNCYCTSEWFECTKVDTANTLKLLTVLYLQVLLTLKFYWTYTDTLVSKHVSWRRFTHAVSENIAFLLISEVGKSVPRVCSWCRCWLQRSPTRAKQQNTFNYTYL